MIGVLGSKSQVSGKALVQGPQPLRDKTAGPWAWHHGPGVNSLLLSCQRVGADPGVGHRQPGRQVEGRQERGQGALQQVRVAADGILGLAHVRALGKEAHVAGWRAWEEREGLREAGSAVFLPSPPENAPGGKGKPQLTAGAEATAEENTASPDVRARELL